MAVLVTGGAGYIGSHTCVELLAAGYEVVVVDNFCNSSKKVLDRIRRISGVELPCYELDLRNKPALQTIFDNENIESVIHFAGLKAVGESVEKPLYYFENNVSGTINLLEVMAQNNVYQIVFSSSATVYGDPHTVPIDETFPLQPTNPYGQSKLMVEQILQHLQNSDDRWSSVILRYFNPVGAHESGALGEDPSGIPNNLVPFISQVAIGQRDMLSVFGGDYPTPDGTGIRDYIHVVDLAKGHLKALEKCQAENGSHTFNLGTGKGYSVLEMITAFEKACSSPIAYKIVSRRVGDIAECYASTALAEKELHWVAEKTLEQMLEDVWRWQTQNPNGYEE